MKTLIAAALLAFATGAFAAEPSCADKAAEKKLAGAAKTSFMTKCEKDAGGTSGDACIKAAEEKKLAGAARNSFLKKCSTDAAASAPKSS